MAQTITSLSPNKSNVSITGTVSFLRKTQGDRGPRVNLTITDNSGSISAVGWPEFTALQMKPGAEALQDDMVYNFQGLITKTNPRTGKVEVTLAPSCKIVKSEGAKQKTAFTSIGEAAAAEIGSNIKMCVALLAISDVRTSKADQSMRRIDVADETGRKEVLAFDDVCASVDTFSGQENAFLFISCRVGKNSSLVASSIRAAEPGEDPPSLRRDTPYHANAKQKIAFASIEETATAEIGSSVKMCVSLLEISDVRASKADQPMRRIHVADETGRKEVLAFDDVCASVDALSGKEDVFLLMSCRISKNNSLVASSICVAEPGEDPLSLRRDMQYSAKASRKASKLADLSKYHVGTNALLRFVMHTVSEPISMEDGGSRITATVVDASSMSARLAIFITREDTQDTSDVVGKVAEATVTVSSFGGLSLKCSKQNFAIVQDDALSEWYAANGDAPFDQIA